MIESLAKEDVRPVCPHCKHEVKIIWYQEIAGFLGKRYIYFCSECKSVLGMSHRKGFWMG